MAKNAVINFRVDKDVKSGMEEVCRKMGINMTTAFDFYCRKVIREKRIPFDVDCSMLKHEERNKVDEAADEHRRR